VLAKAIGPADDEASSGKGKHWGHQAGDFSHDEHHGSLLCRAAAHVLLCQIYFIQLASAKPINNDIPPLKTDDLIYLSRKYNCTTANRYTAKFCNDINSCIYAP
jgi:hypothetical protein